MSRCIESLESRTLLSASTLAADQATLHSDITSLPAFGASSADTVRADAAGQTITNADRALGVAWSKSTGAKYKKLLKADVVGAKATNKAVAKLDAASSAKASAAAARLQAVASKALAAITVDSNALHAADINGLTKIGAAFPSDTLLQTDIGTIESAGASHIATIQTDAGTVFTTDVGAIITA